MLASAAELELAWTLKDGRVEKETAPLVEKGGALMFSLPAATIRAKGAKRLEMTPDFATARKGDAGYWGSTARSAATRATTRARGRRCRCSV